MNNKILQMIVILVQSQSSNFKLQKSSYSLSSSKQKSIRMQPLIRNIMDVNYAINIINPKSKAVCDELKNLIISISGTETFKTMIESLDTVINDPYEHILFSDIIPSNYKKCADENFAIITNNGKIFLKSTFGNWFL